jgi:hypothetical protein
MTIPHYADAPQLSDTIAEEPKVEMATPPLSSWHSGRKGAIQVLRVSRFDFKRAYSTSGTASLTTSLILEFHRREWDCVSPDSAVVVAALILSL